MKAIVLRAFQWMFLGGLAVAVLVVTGLLMGEQTAHALPEFAERTGEPCATCHVNPGGGGPRTLRGMLWSAQGRPDAVPQIENLLIAPGVTEGSELYDQACAGCHGFAGEGLFGRALTDAGLSETKIESTVLRGRERSGMPSFAGQFTDDQLQALVEFVAGISFGRIEPLPDSLPLPAADFVCDPTSNAPRCSGN
ncbi:MAG: c-type cytochrome [Anaerolineales bacterium]